MKTLSRLLRSAAMALCLVASLGCAQQAVDLKPGDKAPDFTLRGSDGQEYSLAQFLGKKAVALCWFPRAGSSGAKAQCASLQAAMASLPTDKVQVFGCSTAALDVTVAFGQQGQYSFPVLADADRSVAQAYGCLRPDGLSLRYTYLINDQGLIVAVNKSITPVTQGADLARMLVAAGLMAGATAPATPATGDQQINIPVGAVTRTCFVHVPPSYDGAKPMPLVIALHGARGNGRGMAGATGFSALADQYGFIAAYPDGIAGDRTWNALFGKIPGGGGVLADDVDDVAFLRGLIEQLHASHHTDPERVFVCGHSAGAYMAYRAAVELSDIIAAAGIVNGSLGIKSLDGKPCGANIPQPVAPVSLIHICGRQDGVVKFDGAQTPKNLFKSVLDCVAFFVAAEGCATPGVTTDDPATQVSRTLYTGGKNGTEVKLVIVQRCNHNWPTPAVGLSATQELWDFFAAHPKQAAVGNAGGAQ
ncbi:redoxin domain-containing protein [bacterium]|nr:redoxin domain-containing protein [bacterium]